MSIQEISYDPEYISSVYANLEPLLFQRGKELQNNSSIQTNRVYGKLPFTLIPAIFLYSVVTSDIQMDTKETYQEFTNNKIYFENYDDYKNDFYDHEMFQFITFLDNQIDVHPERVVPADERQLERIMKLVAGVKVD